jgi:hypothetical protein
VKYYNDSRGPGRQACGFAKPWLFRGKCPTLQVSVGTFLGLNSSQCTFLTQYFSIGDH